MGSLNSKSQKLQEEVVRYVPLLPGIVMDVCLCVCVCLSVCVCVCASVRVCIVVVVNTEGNFV